MKKLVTPKTKKNLRTHPISSKTEGWNIKIVEIYNNAFTIEAIDTYERIISKQGDDPIKLQDEIEELIANIKI